MGDENWQNAEQKRIDLRLENNALIDEIKLRGASFGKSDDIDPEFENQFLKNVIAFEDAWDSPQMRTPA